MKRVENSLFRRWRGDQRGAIAVLVAASIIALVGFGALVFDLAFYFYARSVVQATATAAALAGAQQIGSGGDPICTAVSYSSVANSPNCSTVSGKTTTPVTGNNVVGNLTVTMTAVPALTCAKNWAASSGVDCSTNYTENYTIPTGKGTTTVTCSPTTSSCAAVNLITVTETATVPTFFGRIFGMTGIPVSATATASARGYAPGPYNVAIVLDTTASMGKAPAGAAGAKGGACYGYSSAIACALSGVQTMLGQNYTNINDTLWPCPNNGACGAATNGNVAHPVDEVALFVFPGVKSVPSNYACTGTAPTTEPYAYLPTKTSAKTASGGTTLTFSTNPSFNTGAEAIVRDVTAAPLTPPIPTLDYVSSVGSSTSGHTTTYTATLDTATTGNVASGDTIAIAPIYELVGFSSDYRISDATTSLNTGKSGSDLSNCAENLTAPGGQGTFYADAISAAQNALAAQWAARGGTATNPTLGGQNVMIILTDGDSPGSSNTTQTTQLCQLAVKAAQAAAAANNAVPGPAGRTQVFAIYYDDNTSSTCSTDTGSVVIGETTYNYSGTAPNGACAALMAMANTYTDKSPYYENDPTKFYSTDGSSGACPSSQNNYSTIGQIFQQILNSLTTVRLVPPGTS
jgi:Flp pilus assembly protein TadG